MKRFPHYKQHDTMDCGPACLKIIAQYFGRGFSIDYLRNLCHTDKTGTSIFALIEAMNQIGIDGVARKSTVADLIEDSNLPLILFWKQKHYVVLYKVRGKKYFISDPAHGLLTLNEEEFFSSWISQSGEGIYIALSVHDSFRTSNTETDLNDLSGFKRVYNYLFKYKKTLIQLIAGLITSCILQAVFPFLTKMIVDVGIAEKNISVIYLILLGQLFVFIGKTTVDLIRNHILLKLSTKININLLKDFYIKLMHLPVSFFDTRKLGDILQRINDHKRVESFLTSGTLNTVFSVMSLFVFGFVLAFYNPLIFIVFLVGSCVYVLWILAFMKKRAELDFKLFSQMSANHEKNYELIVGMQELRLHNAETKRRIQWEALQVKLFRLNVDVLSLKQIQSGGAVFINELKNILITFLTAKLVVSGEISLGVMLSISYITGQLNSPILQIIDFIQSFQDAKLSLIRINEIHDKALEENESLETIIEDPIGDIVLNNLSFKYDSSPNAPMVLDNLNFRIPANKVTAIVGSSGSGKSTLLKLLLKVYKPTKGSISLGNIPFETLSHKAWREKCGVVMQEGYIFNDTVINNIAVNDVNPDMSRIHSVSKLANIYNYILNLPNGFFTLIGGNGVSMSTGQRQRILIARALYKNPSVLILDEATSALDANNEKEITQNLELLYRNKTVIIVAHRLSTVCRADNIVVLDKGKISEYGTHEKLVNEKGLYYSLVKNQLELGK